MVYLFLLIQFDLPSARVASIENLVGGCHEVDFALQLC